VRTAGTGGNPGTFAFRGTFVLLVAANKMARTTALALVLILATSRASSETCGAPDHDTEATLRLSKQLAFQTIEELTSTLERLDQTSSGDGAKITGKIAKDAGV
jgi:hypothetical protein